LWAGFGLFLSLNASAELKRHKNTPLLYCRYCAWAVFNASTHAHGDRVMNIKPINSQADLAAAFARLEQLWGAEGGSPEGDELETLALLIEKYEDEHYPMQPSEQVV
jgi:HTH-type transcriptional regulator/antitoxin HigA